MDSYISIFNNLLILHHKIHYIILHHVILYSLLTCFLIIYLKKFSFLSLFSFMCFHEAMHGVGSKWILRAFDLFGHAPFIPVSSQAEPDPEFHTVTFPNPEEKGVNKDTLIFIFYNFIFIFPSCLFFLFLRIYIFYSFSFLFSFSFSFSFSFFLLSTL